jgi:uncharacterized protein DUF6929
MIRRVIARQDPALTACVVRSRPLRYTAGADPALDRPAHVRAGSSLAQLGSCLIVVQDDANFIAVIDPHTWQVRAVSLPAGEGGLRQFDDLRGNKHFKRDLEACVAIPGASDDLLLAFGSGSSSLREQIAVIRNVTGLAPEITVVDAPELYATLRAASGFAGSDMNIEGAVFLEGRIRLFGRGNGIARDGLLPIDATCDLDWPTLAAYLQHPRVVAPPTPDVIVQYQLGTIDGVRLGFTDATFGHDTLIFSAAAEASPDATRDGPVVGAALGVFDSVEHVRWTVLRDQTGALFGGKVEGVLLDATQPTRVYVIVDRDAPGVPSELCEVVLSGPWFRVTSSDYLNQ